MVDFQQKSSFAEASQIYELQTSDLRAMAPRLQAGDKVLLTGTVFTARDAAHKRFFALLEEGKSLPVELQDAVVYYAGPTPAPEGRPIGSCGPTTSGRMDPYVSRLMDELGLVAMIGKGERNEDVKAAIQRNQGVYFCAIGGAGALAAQHVVSCEVAAFDDLGCESVKRLKLERFPVVVANDCHGGDLFSRGREAYALAPSGGSTKNDSA